MRKLLPLTFLVVAGFLSSCEGGAGDGITSRYNHGGNIQRDSLFVNAWAGNFRLQQGSPCIDAGNNDIIGLLQIETDKDGNPRIVGNAVDIGAYEGAVTIYTLTVSKGSTGSGTVTSTPAGINCGQTCIANFPANAQVTLTASPASGSVFVVWGGDCANCGNNTQCMVIMSADRTCTATFSLASGGTDGGGTGGGGGGGSTVGQQPPAQQVGGETDGCCGYLCPLSCWQEELGRTSKFPWGLLPP